MGSVLGIDPGQKGALVALDGDLVLMAEIMPAAPKVGVDLAAVLDMLEGLRPDRVVVERAQAMPASLRGRAMGGASTAAYMRDYGGILGLLCALRIPHETVHPATWHRQLIGSRGGDPKARALEVVRQRIPMLALPRPRCRLPHQGIIDAACIALWGSR